MPNGLNDWTMRDRWNRAVVYAFTPVLSGLLVALVALATFYVQSSFSEVKKNTDLVSQESKETAKKVAVLEETVSTVKESIQKIEKSNEKISDKLDLLIERQRK